MQLKVKHLNVLRKRKRKCIFKIILKKNNILMSEDLDIIFFFVSSRYCYVRQRRPTFWNENWFSEKMFHLYFLVSERCLKRVDADRELHKNK